MPTHRTVIRTLLPCLLLTSFTGSALAQWIQTSGPKGGSVRALATAPNGSGGTSVFAGQLYVWRTDDAGGSWARFTSGLTDPNAFSVLPLGNNVLLLGTNGGVFRSTDNGSSWAASSNGLTATSVYSLASGPNGTGGRYVYAGTSGGNVFRSNDDGMSWTGASTPTSGVTGIVLSVTGSGTVLAGTGNGIYRSTNFGASWTRAATMYGFSFARNGSTLYAGTSSGVHRSSDDGATWTAINSGIQFTWVNAVAAVSNGSGVTLFAGAGGVLKSTDNGATWAPASNGITSIGVSALATVPNGSGGSDLYAGTNQGVFRSSDLGASWTDVSFPYSIVRALEVTPTGTILAGTENDVFRSTDGGATWVDRNAGTAPLDFAKNLQGAQGTSVFAGTSPVGISKSTDDGLTWVDSNNGIYDMDVNSMSVIPNGSGGSTVVAGTYSGIFVSTQDGAGWQSVEPRFMPLEVVLAPNGNGQDVFGGGFNGIWKSTNYGATWASVGGPLATQIVRGMASTGGGTTLFAGGDPFGIYRSTDHGITWTPANTGIGDTRITTLLSPDGVNLFAGGAGGVYRSTDNGNTWASVATGLSVGVNRLVVAADGATLLAGTSGLGVWKRPLSEMIQVQPPPPPPPAPSIASFTPTSGPVGTLVTVNGSNFGGASAVTFGGAPSSYTVLSSSQIRATVPPNAATGRVTVTTAGGTATSSGDFTVTVPPPPPPPTTLTFTPPHDAYVRSSSANGNFGSTTDLRVRGGSQTYRSYLKFVVSGVVGAVQSATLRLRVVDPGPDGGAAFAVSNNLRNTATPWTEAALTWNNAPTLSGSALDAEGSVTANTWVELNVTAAVTGNGTYSFALSGSSSNEVDYSSSEGSNPPQLVVVASSGSALTQPVMADAAPVLAAREPVLHANSPNPFNPETTIRYSLPRATQVRLYVYDVSGRLVRRLEEGMEPAGERAVTWNGRDDRGTPVGSGVYIYRLDVDGMRLTRKMSLLK
jgi:photosystem II stability/assembly factor-like uncharacterized protein